MEIAEIAAFLAFAKTGTVLAAAKNLKLSRATVRRRLESLERTVGRPLFERQRDKVVLTRVGRLLEQEGALLLGSARRLESVLRQAGAESVAGTLSVALPVGLPGHLFTAFARELAERWPRLEIFGLFTSDPLAELERNADIAITSGNRPAAPWVSRSIADLEDRAFAHVSYVERAGLPRSVAELQNHRLISWSTPEEDGTQWPLRRGGTCRVRPAMATNDVRSVLECIEAGLGIGLLPLPPLAAELHPVMPEILGRRRRFWLASAPAGRWSPSVRAFAQALVTFLKGQMPTSV